MTIDWPSFWFGVCAAVAVPIGICLIFFGIVSGWKKIATERSILRGEVPSDLPDDVG